MFAKPQAEHRWLEQLVGTWDFEHECRMHDGTQSSESGTMVCRSLGGMWLLAESKGGESSATGPWSNLLTVGYDTEKKQFVGTFIGSMMSMIWPYHGALDESGRRLRCIPKAPSWTEPESASIAIRLKSSTLTVGCSSANDKRRMRMGPVHGIGANAIGRRWTALVCLASLVVATVARRWTALVAVPTPWQRVVTKTSRRPTTQAASGALQLTRDIERNLPHDYCKKYGLFVV